jgi:Na+/H+-dicarboxylate symporter/ABC-type amino acid transport substrate-binding protein
VKTRPPESPSAGAASAPDIAKAGKRGLRAISLPVWIILGAILGIVAGIVFGQRIAIVQPLGSAYAMMLQIAVYPYLLSALLSGLGRLTPATAGRMFAASWVVYLFMWAVTFTSIWLLARAIPPTPLPSVLTPDSLQKNVEFLNLLIPANLFDALGRNYVPAVVVFAIIYGIAIQRIERKSALFEVLEAIQVASVTIWRWVVVFAPIGVFALFASAAGTVEPGRLATLALYMGLFLAGTLLLAFVVLPSALAAVTPLGYREILKELQPALVLAAVTTLSVVALPFVQQAAERAATAAGCPEGEERSDVIKATLSLSYVLAQLGNYFVYLLMLYAGYEYQVRFSTTEQLLLPLWTLLSGLGSPSATVDGVIFIGRWLNLGPGILDLFLETWTVTRYGQVILSVMGFGFATILIPLIYFGKARLSVPRAVTGTALSVVLLGAVVAGGIALRPHLVPQFDSAQMRLTLDPELAQSVQAKVYRVADIGMAVPPTDRFPALSAIRSTGLLRVGYNPDVMPFSYLNEHNDLVGYDISFAYELAKDLRARLELVPFAWPTLSQDLTSRRFDVAMSGVYETDDRVQALTVSDAYDQSPVALIVRSERAPDFLSHAQIDAMPEMRMVVFDDPVLMPMARSLFPQATIKTVPNYDGLPAIASEFDAALWTLRQAGAWAKAHPGFTAVAPSGFGGPIIMSYEMGPGDMAMRQYLNHWLELKTTSGFKAAQVDYWFKGKPRADPRPRWNLLDA